MVDPNTTYVPISPDLSAYHADAPPSTLPPLSATSQTYVPPTPPAHQQNYSFPTGRGNLQPPTHSSADPSFLSPTYFPPPPPHQQQARPQSAYHPPSISTARHTFLSHAAGSRERDPDGEYIPTPTTAATPTVDGPPRRGRKPKPKPDMPPTPQRAAPDPASLKPFPGQVEGITVHTKFPVARIKRIMQADEDVGKVAQVTPTAVSKALELFMVSLVTKSAAKARERSSKKVTAQHLKGVVLGDESFDFLAEIVGRVQEGQERKEVSEDEGAAVAQEGRGAGERAGGKRKRGERAGGGGGRRRKADDDDED